MKTNANAIGLVASAALTVLAPPLGLLGTVVTLNGSFERVQGAGVDASQKARVLSSGISGAMNWTIAGLVVSALALVATVVFALRWYRSSRPPRPVLDAG